MAGTSSVGFNRYALSAVVFVIGSGVAVSAERPASNLKAGRTAYEQSCARCHGVNGEGDGVDAKRFYPRPRNFKLGAYKFRTSVSDVPPTDEDLFHTITYGLPGTNMPDWQHFDETTRWQLVDYLKSLSPRFQESRPKPVPIKETGPTPDLTKGKTLFQKFGCVACHGPNGRANGTSAAGLVDDWGMPIRPANLTQGWAYRGGSDPRSIVFRVMAGIEGAGMPSFAEAISEDDAWQMAYYVQSLQEPAQWNMIAHAKVVGSLPETATDPRWALAERTNVRLRHAVNATGEWVVPPTVQSVAVQIMANDKDAVFRLTWDDPTQDENTPHDGLAVLLKPAGSQGDVVTLQAWPYDGAPALDLCYWSAETGQAFETIATEYDSVLARQTPQALVTSTATYEDGRWTLLLRRPLERTSPDAAAVIARDGLTAMAFAVWDGGNPKARAVSPWIDISVRSGHAPSHAR